MPANVYYYRLILLDEPKEATSHFLARDDKAAVYAAFRLGAVLAAHTRILRVIVESVVLGMITAEGVCETTRDRVLYDSDNLVTSILEERPAYLT